MDEFINNHQRRGRRVSNSGGLEDDARRPKSVRARRLGFVALALLAILGCRAPTPCRETTTLLPAGRKGGWGENKPIYAQCSNDKIAERTVTPHGILIVCRCPGRAPRPRSTAAAPRAPAAFKTPPDAAPLVCLPGAGPITRSATR